MTNLVGCLVQPNFEVLDLTDAFIEMESAVLNRVKVLLNESPVASFQQWPIMDAEVGK